MFFKLNIREFIAVARKKDSIVLSSCKLYLDFLCLRELIENKANQIVNVFFNAPNYLATAFICLGYIPIFVLMLPFRKLQNPDLLVLESLLYHIETINNALKKGSISLG